MYFLGLARRLKDRCEVLFVLPEGTDSQFTDFCRQSGIPFATVATRADLGPAEGLARKLERHVNKIRSEAALVRAVWREAGDGTAVHVELSPWQSLTALLLLALRGPVFVTMHNRLPGVSGWRRRLWGIKFRIAAACGRFSLFPSNADARDSLRPFVPAGFLGRTPVTYTNVDPDEVASALSGAPSRSAARGRFGIADDALLVVTVGQFIDRKGRWTLLEAASLVAAAHPKAVFAWVANNEPAPGDLERIEAYGLGDRFRLIRSADVGPAHLDLMRFLAAADIFALPSFVEGLPISLLEGMAMGLPAVSTRVNAIPEAVADGETGLLVEAGDAKALAAALAALAEDAALRERLGLAGRARVLARFSETEVAEVAFEHYLKAFGEVRR